jgi:hypothetical protein
MSKAATNHDSAQLDLFRIEVRQAVAEVVAEAFDKERTNVRRRILDPRRDLSQYPAIMSVKQVKTFLDCSFQHVINLYDSGALVGSDMSRPGSSQRYIKFERAEVAAYVERTKRRHDAQLPTLATHH